MTGMKQMFLSLGLAAMVVSLSACACGPCSPDSEQKDETSGEAKVDIPEVKCKPGMVGIPAGTFTMGDAKNTEKAGSVSVDAFCMSKLEVTAQDYWSKCAKSGQCKKPKRFFEKPIKGGPPPLGHACNLWWSSNATGAGARKDHPMNCVNWGQAAAYCKAQGLRLPTEQEWEYAARSSDNRIYPVGDSIGAVSFCWSGPGSRKKEGTCKVGIFAENYVESPFGVSDMAGNLMEWTSSKQGEKRIVRGGNYSSFSAEYIAAARRNKVDPGKESYWIGFRCVGVPQP